MPFVKLCHTQMLTGIWDVDCSGFLCDWGCARSFQKQTIEYSRSLRTARCAEEGRGIWTSPQALLLSVLYLTIYVHLCVPHYECLPLYDSRLFAPRLWALLFGSTTVLLWFLVWLDDLSYKPGPKHNHSLTEAQGEQNTSHWSHQANCSWEQWVDKRCVLMLIKSTFIWKRVKTRFLLSKVPKSCPKVFSYFYPNSCF